MKNKQILKQILLLVVCLAIGSIHCVIRGQDATWDLQNYHLYNPFAFLHNRYGQDLFAAGIHSTLNPLLDIPYYLLFRALFHHPVLLVVIWGFVFGLCIWLMYQIVDRIFEKQEWWWKVFTVGLAATAAGTSLQASLITGESCNLVILLTSVWCFVVFVQDPQKRKFVYWAGFLAGFAAGCKFTAAYYCIALFAALIPNIRYTEKPLKTAVLFCLLGTAGFLLANGYFMWKWYSMYGNPLFPYYNNVFKSPYFDPIYLSDPQFLPQNIIQWLFYPFYWVWYSVDLVIEGGLADKRLALGYIAAVFLGYRLLRRIPLSVNRRMVSSLLILTVVSYIVWLYKFSLIRYACIIEFLACVLIFIALDAFIKKSIKIILVLLVMCACIFSADIPVWRHVRFDTKTVVGFTVKPEIEDNALVFFMIQPTSYLVPLLNPKASYMGGFISIPEEYPEKYRKEAVYRVKIPKHYYRFHIEDLQREKIKQHKGPLYILSSDWPMLFNEKTLARFGLKKASGECTFFITNWTYDSPPLALCPVEKESENETQKEIEKGTARKPKNRTENTHGHKTGNETK